MYVQVCSIIHAAIEYLTPSLNTDVIVS